MARRSEDPDVIVVGGGPAGMMAGLLFARAGVRTRVLEKHGDFLRDFRGDTVHPSTMEILGELGMLERFLERPHDRLDRAQISIAGRDYAIGDLSKLRSRAPFIAMMPQWEFLDFLKEEAARFPAFGLEMNAEAEGFTFRDGRVTGVHLADGRDLSAKRLVLAADGRSSLVRRQKLLPDRQLGAPMDVLWFRLPKLDNPGEALRGSIATGRMVVLIDRRDYWQCAFLIPKGKADEVRSRGAAWIVGQVGEAFPDLDFKGEGGPESRDDFRLLEVTLDRLTRWHRPGLLAIGDAAHAMSPIGGIGINLAIQDAVAAANALAGPLARGEEADGRLDLVQQRRILPTRLVQAAQRTVQDRVIGTVLKGTPVVAAPWFVRLLDAVPVLRRLPGRAIGFGVRREHVRSPAADRSG